MTVLVQRLRRHAPAWICLGVAACLLVLGANCIRPLPFATTDDNWMYFLPLIKAHTDALLGGHPLHMLWQLGAGWSPYESGQIGLYYPPYLVANLLARAIGQPLALLEVSASLHLWAAAVVTWHLVPLEGYRAERYLWALTAIVPVGSLLLGLNWHNYISCYPWFLAIVFVVSRINRGCASLRLRVLLYASSLGFFASSHVQMYVIGMSLAIVWIFVEYDRRWSFGALLVLIICQIPFFLPLIYLKGISLDANILWMQERMDPSFILRHAQSLESVIHGTIFGNFFKTDAFGLWEGVSLAGIGMFFCPLLVFLFIACFKLKSWMYIMFFSFILMFMSAATFSFVENFAIGPFAGFRWTWKICIFLQAFVFVALAPRMSALFLTAKTRIAVLLFAVIASISVFVRGIDFDVWPSLCDAHPLGANVILDEVGSMMAKTGIKRGDRIVYFGHNDMCSSIPLPVIGLMGNAPILSGIETAHLFEPMESNRAAKSHFYLGLPWRTHFTADDFLKDKLGTVDGLKEIGVNYIVTNDIRFSDESGAVAYIDRYGRKTIVLPVLDSDPSVPYPLQRFGTRDSRRLANGDLFVRERPESIDIGRTLRWVPEGNGWRGIPPTVPLSIILGTIGLSLCSFALVWRGALPGMWRMDLGNQPTALNRTKAP